MPGGSVWLGSAQRGWLCYLRWMESPAQVISRGCFRAGRVWWGSSARQCWQLCPLQDGDTDKKDPFEESGLSLSPTAAEAKEKVRAKRVKKRAPQMDWNKKREIFSNF